MRCTYDHALPDLRHEPPGAELASVHALCTLQQRQFLCRGLEQPERFPARPFGDAQLPRAGHSALLQAGNGRALICDTNVTQEQLVAFNSHCIERTPF